MERGTDIAMHASVINWAPHSSGRPAIVPTGWEYAGSRDRVNHRAAAVSGIQLAGPCPEPCRDDAGPGLADALAGTALYGVLVMLAAVLA